MKRRLVGLVDLGESASSTLNRLSRRLNSIQRAFEFSIVDSITLEAVGDPDVDEVWYSSNRLFDVMRHRVRTADFDLIIGLTHLPLASLDAHGKTIDKNYFALSDLDRLSIVTLHPNVMVYKSPWKTDNQYAAYLMIGELLINLARQDLMHLMANQCLFDDCVDRTRLAQCIDKSHICDKCRGKLKEQNVSESLITEVEKVLSWCRRTTAGAAFAYSLNHPVTALCLGIGLGWFTSVFVSGAHYSLMILTTLALPVLLFLRKLSGR